MKLKKLTKCWSFQKFHPSQKSWFAIVQFPSCQVSWKPKEKLYLDKADTISFHLTLLSLGWRGGEVKKAAIISASTAREGYQGWMLWHEEERFWLGHQALTQCHNDQLPILQARWSPWTHWTLIPLTCDMAFIFMPFYRQPPSLFTS